MEKFVEFISNANGAVNGVVWGTFGISLLFFAGLLMTIVNRGFQFSHFGHWMKKTIGAIFTDKKVTRHTGKENKAISQFQSLCTALAATIGTGNIVGVATAIVLGGPGAIFWMWIMAIFGMMTNYSENVLGIFFRKKAPSVVFRQKVLHALCILFFIRLERRPRSSPASACRAAPNAHPQTHRRRST